jgi:hypothetical protein
MGKLAPGLCLVLAAALAQPARGGEAPGDRERQIRAALVFKIARFVTWPAKAFARPDDFTFCFAGDDAVAQALAAIDGRPIQNRRAQLRRLADADKLTDGECNLLYLGGRSTLGAEGLATATDSSVLVVADVAQAAAMVELTERSNRMRLTINLGLVRAAQLRIDAPLLQLAEVRQ